GVQRDDPPQGACPNPLSSNRIARVEAADVAYHQDGAGFLGRPNDAITLGRGAGHGLFQEDMLPHPQSRERRRGVVVDVGDDADRLHPWVGQQLVIVPEGPHTQAALYLPQAFLTPRAYGAQLGLGQGSDHFRVFLPEESQANYTVANGSHGLILWLE